MLDRKKRLSKEPTEVARPSISVKTVFVIVGMLFAVLVYALYFFRYSDLSPLYSYYHQSTSDAAALSNSVQTEVGKTKNGDAVEIKITESQLTSALCVSCSSFPLKKASAKMTEDGVIIEGKTSNSFWGVNLQITMKPKADKGKVVFELAEFQAAGVAAPPSITKTYSQKLKDAFADLIPGASSVDVSEVHNLIGSLIVIGTKK